jgi:hypothetical protein
MLHGNRPTAHRGSEAESGRTQAGQATSDSPDSFGGEVAELALLLTTAEVAALESAAHAGRMTVAQLLRCLIRDCLVRWVVPAARLENSRGGES